VSAACLAREGHDVIGVDVYPDKVALVGAGQSPIVEAGLDDLVRWVVSERRLSASADAAEAVHRSDVSLVCVGTPSCENGSLDLRYVVRCCQEIGSALRDSDSYHVVVIRSTILPGTVDEHVRPVLERASGKVAGAGFGLCVNPEFLREGTSIADFYDPPFTLIGEVDARSGDALAPLYAFLDAPMFRCDINTAEMVKYANNAFHGLKVAFANELGNLCKKRGIDSHVLMDIFCADTKLNLSPYYLKPGFAFGGSCLPKDLRALTYHARQQDLQVPVLDAILRSNEQQVRQVIDFVLRLKKRRIGILGLSFKAGTDDLRESPMVLLSEALLGKGLQLRIYDANVRLARLVGANRRFIEHEIPHISSLLCDSVDDVLAESDVIIIGNRGPEFGALTSKASAHHVIVDLVRAVDGRAVPDGHYWGICW
jgi:GDP-mannose 6-dehydrogenase